MLNNGLKFIEYQIKCLEQLRRDLSKQMKKYPTQMAWIELELAKLYGMC